MLDLLGTFSWQELRRHPWRTATALVAVMLGVALGFAVHVINASALGEFSQAMRSVGGQPDLELRATRGHLPESLYGLVAAQPQVALASPWLELPVRASSAAARESADSPRSARADRSPGKTKARAAGGAKQAAAPTRAARGGKAAAAAPGKGGRKARR